MPTTRSGRLPARLPVPSPPLTVARVTVSPTWAPIRSRSTRPSAISPGRCGSRPDSTGIGDRPLTRRSATPVVTTPLIRTLPPSPTVTAVTRGSAAIAAVSSGLASTVAKSAIQPYLAGVCTSRSRLAAKVPTATTPAMPNTATSAVTRTGTAARPPGGAARRRGRPGSAPAGRAGAAVSASRRPPSPSPAPAPPGPR